MTESEKLGELFDEAQAAFDRRDWTVAIDRLEKVVRMNPDQPGALKLLEEAHKRRAAHSKYLIGLGCRHRKQWARAIEELEMALRDDPDHHDAKVELKEVKRLAKIDQLLNEADEHRRKSEWEQVEIALQVVLKLDPDSEEIKRLLDDAQRERIYQEGSADQWSLSIEWKWLLLAIGLSGVGVLTCRRQLHCLLCYKLTEVSLVIIFGVGGVLVARFAKLLPPDKRAILESLTTGICLVFFGFIVSAVFLPDPSREQCSSTLPKVITSVQTPLALCNGDFADGFECWQHGGELVQSVECDGGQCYAILGSPDYPCYYGVPVGEAWIRQTLEVPQVVSPTLSLRYRVLSYDLDLPGYDYFQVTINGERFPERYGNHEWSEPSCDREAWDSGWQTLTLDLSAYRGKEIEISFHNVNGTQAFFNTWTYVDDVRIGGVY